jgi:hypothetical protein
MVCPGYWTARHSSKLDVVEHVFNVAEKLVRRLPPPWRRAKRGRRPKFSARRHATICIVRQYFDYALREVEGQSLSFMGKTIDHSTVGKAFKRLRVNYLKLLVLLLRRELTRFIHCEFYVVDSTGISTPRLVTRRKAFKPLREREFLKLHALMGYSRRASALVVFSARVTRANVSDGSQLGYLLKGLRAGGEPLLADSAYDIERNLKLALEQGFRPVIKPRSVKYRGIFRRHMLREFKRNCELYRQRGIAEALFGGLANRYGTRTRCKRVRTKTISMLLMLVAHNLRTLARVRAAEKTGYLFMLLIYSTNPAPPVEAEEAKGSRHFAQARRAARRTNRCRL